VATTTAYSSFCRTDTHLSSRHVRAILEQMPPELLQHVCNFLPSLNVIYNMRRTFKAATKMYNSAYQRARFSRDAMSCINAEAQHKNDPLIKNIKFRVCSTTLPPSKLFWQALKRYGRMTSQSRPTVSMTGATRATVEDTRRVFIV